MTRKDYRVIANACKATKPNVVAGKPIAQDVYADFQWGRTVIAIADALATDNPRFKYATFYDACGGI